MLCSDKHGNSQLYHSGCHQNDVNSSGQRAADPAPWKGQGQPTPEGIDR